MFDEKELKFTLKVLGLAVRERWIPPPYPPLHDVIDVFEIFREAEPPSAPFKHVPFPEEYDIGEKVHPVITVDVALLDRGAIFTIDAFTLA